jgi:hypothetical protein
LLPPGDATAVSWSPKDGFRPKNDQGEFIAHSAGRILVRCQKKRQQREVRAYPGIAGLKKNFDVSD